MCDGQGACASIKPMWCTVLLQFFTQSSVAMLSTLCMMLRGTRRLLLTFPGAKMSCCWLRVTVMDQ